MLLTSFVVCVMMLIHLGARDMNDSWICSSKLLQLQTYHSEKGVAYGPKIHETWRAYFTPSTNVLGDGQ